MPRHLDIDLRIQSMVYLKQELYIEFEEHREEDQGVFHVWLMRTTASAPVGADISVACDAVALPAGRGVFPAARLPILDDGLKEEIMARSH